MEIQKSWSHDIFVSPLVRLSNNSWNIPSKRNPRRRSKHNTFVLTDSSVYQITSINGKELGLVATRCISADEKIFEDRLLLKGNVTKLKRRFGVALAQFSNTERQKVRALYNVFPEDNDVEILVTKSYGLGPEGELCGLFEKLSRVNHSCRSNSKRCWDNGREMETLYALHCIQIDEELTISYFDNTEMTRVEREVFVSTTLAVGM